MYGKTIKKTKKNLSKKKLYLHACMYAYMHANSSEVCLPIAKSHKYGTSTRHSRLRFCVIMHVNIIETTTIGCIKHETFRIETIVVKLKHKIIFATGNLKYLL
jgi:hypothetical protein